METESNLDQCLMRKTAAAPFLVKTYMVVEDPATDGVVSWNQEGTAFVVWQPAEFARDLLPTLFKHANFSSFVRQLNTYGFRKVATNRWEFSNQMFRRGERDELGKICRRSNKAKPKDHSYTNLIQENQRLKRENGVLNWELNVMKNKLLDLASVYGRKLELERQECIKLFGVRMEVQAGDDYERENKRKMAASFLLSQS